MASIPWLFQYATYIARLHGSEGTASDWEEVKRLGAWVHLWYGCSGSTFLRAYLETAAAGVFLPQRRVGVARAGLLDLLKAPSALGQGGQARTGAWAAG